MEQEMSNAFDSSSCADAIATEDAVKTPEEVSGNDSVKRSLTWTEPDASNLERSTSTVPLNRSLIVKPPVPPGFSELTNSLDTITSCDGKSSSESEGTVSSN
jgi:hypothetical protein